MTDTVGALRTAAAIECLHAYSLIHDDLPAMDDADTRRGKPSVHMLLMTQRQFWRGCLTKHGL